MSVLERVDPSYADACLSFPKFSIKYSRSEANFVMKFHSYYGFITRGTLGFSKT